MHTVIGSAVIFLCVWAFLSRVLLKPFLALIEEREARTVGDEHSAVEMKKDAKLLQAKAEEELRLCRLAGIEARDARVQAAKEEGQRLVERTSANAAEELKRAQDSIEQLKVQAYREIPAEAEKLADLVLAKALSTEMSRTVH